MTVQNVKRAAIILAAILLASCATPQYREAARLHKWCRTHSWNYNSEQGRALSKACARARVVIEQDEMDPLPNVPASLKD